MAQFIQTVPRPAVPVDCLQLCDDIKALETCRKLLESIDPGNVNVDREEGYKVLRMARAHVGACWRHAWDKMRQDYLAPERKKILPKIERSQ